MIKSLSLAFICPVVLFFFSSAELQRFNFYVGNKLVYSLVPFIGNEKTQDEERSSLAILSKEIIALTGAQKFETIELLVDLRRNDFTQIELEKSNKGNDFMIIAMLSGQPQVKNKLIFVDHYPVLSYQLYRVKCIRKDGSFIYSSTASILYESNT